MCLTSHSSWTAALLLFCVGFNMSNTVECSRLPLLLSFCQVSAVTPSFVPSFCHPLLPLLSTPPSVSPPPTPAPFPPGFIPSSLSRYSSSSFDCSLDSSSSAAASSLSRLAPVCTSTAPPDGSCYNVRLTDTHLPPLPHSTS